jgi:MFS family permease
LTIARLPRPVAFWGVAFGFATITAFSTAPSALYGFYQRQEGFSSLTITFVYAAYAVGIVVSLVLVGHLSDWYGRRTLLVPGLTFGIAAAVIFMTSKSLPALLVARVLTGVAVGASGATATAYLADLDCSSDDATSRRARIVATICNIGGLGLGALLSGVLARCVSHPLTVSYAVVLGLLAVGVVVVVVSPKRVR